MIFSKKRHKNGKNFKRWRQWTSHEGRAHPILRTLVIVTGVVMVWRGLLGFMDMYLFPGDPVLSYAVSTVGGLCLLFLDDFRLKELR